MSRGRLLVLVLLVSTAAAVWIAADIVIDRETDSVGRMEDANSGPLALPSPPSGGDFTLRAASGPIQLADLRGKVVLIYFGYTWCPDVCPTNLAIIASALRELARQELEDVRVLFVSVDPERDTPSRLAEYTGYFHPHIIGVTGSSEAVARAAELYGAAYGREESDSAMGYLIYHTAYTYVVDRMGRLVQRLDHATPPAQILETLRAQLATPPVAAVSRD